VALTRTGSRATRIVLTGGALISGCCFAIAILLEMFGATRGTGRLTDLAGIAASAARLEAWGWSSLGVVVIVATPAIALVATALEYARAHDGRTAWTAVAVLGVLGVSLVVALVR
jgi:hypothetical protein